MLLERVEAGKYRHASRIAKLSIFGASLPNCLADMCPGQRRNLRLNLFSPAPASYRSAARGSFINHKVDKITDCRQHRVFTHEWAR